jgi:hypothetical protein
MCVGGAVRAWEPVAMLREHVEIEFFAWRERPTSGGGGVGAGNKCCGCIISLG